MRQMALPLKSWGGKRVGAGRKPVGSKAGVSHRVRERVTEHTPVHVTMRVRAGVANLRRPKIVRGLLVALGGGAGSERGAFRLVQYSIQSNHLHLIVEARGNAALARGMQGLAIRVARTVNRLVRASGRVFADRYHAQVLSSPRQARNALLYVLNNARKHHAIGTGAIVDPYSSAAWFDGWRPGGVKMLALATENAVVRRASSWLLEVGWRRAGLLDPAAVPCTSMVQRPARG